MGYVFATAVADPGVEPTKGNRAEAQIIIRSISESAHQDGIENSIGPTSTRARIIINTASVP